MGRNEEGVRDWVKVFESHTPSSLLHLDMSFNNYSLHESQMIANGIFHNHSIYGFHFSGNYGDVDCKGFLKIPPTPQPIINNSQWQIQNNIKGCDYQGGNSTNCWICQGYEEVTFYWRPNVSGNVSSEFILLHLSFDNFEPHLMNRKFTSFQRKKMCPTNTKIYYFFTVSGNQYYSKDKTLKHEEIVDKDIVIPFYDENVRVRVPRMNYIYNPKTNKKIIDEEYHPLIDLKPRFFEEIKYKMSAEDVKIPWTVENSLFKDYRVENEEFLEKCFLKDWDCSKIEKLLGQGNEDVIQSKAHL